MPVAWSALYRRDAVRGRGADDHKNASAQSREELYNDLEVQLALASKQECQQKCVFVSVC